MPIEVVDRYKIQCLRCNYVWETKYPRIPAKCPSCKDNIHNTVNYNLITQYIHHEKTEEEKKLSSIRYGIVTLLVILFFVLWFKIGFLASLMLCIIIYSGSNEFISKKILKK